MSADDLMAVCKRHPEHAACISLNPAKAVGAQATPNMQSHVVAHQVNQCPSSLGLNR